MQKIKIFKSEIGRDDSKILIRRQKKCLSEADNVDFWFKKNAFCGSHL